MSWISDNAKKLTAMYVTILVYEINTIMPYT